MRALRLALLGALLLLGGCGEETLYSGLSERDANAMVALLQRAGLPATKTRTVENTFSVATDPEYFAVAVDTLQANGLPEREYDTLGKVFRKEGFVSSPLEERARLNHALSDEIARTLSSIDGVLLARVHLAVPAGDELRDVQPPSSASVFVKHRADVDLTDSISRIKALVVNGIENLPYDNVTVALFAAQETRLVPSVPDVPAASDGSLPTLSATSAASAPAWSFASVAKGREMVVALLVGAALIALATLLHARRGRGGDGRG